MQNSARLALEKSVIVALAIHAVPLVGSDLRCQIQIIIMETKYKIPIKQLS